ncbi:hypothetical protein CDO52_15605 [Nocardiopsis gilva YIM 90087]|uniref:Uncharacterized protein n=1 Tax=Nocardiopsis gilva YIM 90087 TaxID=1235441 RepID=A0A223S7D6_9ACTN|nr:hypothetical protein [Nocardiopsis gilva]ASU84023.1 hypothetical protein CDO52_15605 [Nocardiopsis gilva YIM 90087]
MGDEGGVHIVARNVREFLQLLGALPTDREPDIEWECFGIRECDDLVENEHYLAWLEQTVGLSPADDPAGVIASAQDDGRTTHPFVERVTT